MLSLLLVLVLQAMIVTSCRAADVYNPPDCGTNALFILMQLEGLGTGLEEVQESLPAPHELRYSMLELQTAARQCGLKMVGKTFGPKNVPLDAPAIAYRPGHKPASGHFVVLRPVGTNHTVVQVIDPPYAPRVIEYRALFGGDGQPVTILRPSTRFEQWVPAGVGVILIGSILSMLQLVRRRAKRATSI